MPPGFINTLENIQKGLKIKEIIPVPDLGMKKNAPNWNTEVKLEFKLMRKIPINAFSFDVIQRSQEKNKLKFGMNLPPQNNIAASLLIRFSCIQKDYLRIDKEI